MINVREVYPGMNEPFYGPGDYTPLLKSFGYDILLQVDDIDYQGDSRILFKNGDQYGYLIFGWGSCSGCDALQACETYKEIEELQQNLHADIKWFTKDDLVQYLKEKDWETEWSWHYEETKKFITEAIKLLEGTVQ